MGAPFDVRKALRFDELRTLARTSKDASQVRRLFFACSYF